ncbi:MAG: lytic transglycosylase domain-containing protein [Pseudomonadota bacterium]
MPYSVHMVRRWIKAGVFVVAVTGLAAASVASFQDQLEWAKSKLGGTSADPAANAALSAAITDWRSLNGIATAPFDSYARFLLAHPGWPGDVQMRKAAEAALQRAPFSANLVISFFRRYPPQTASAWMRYAQALGGFGTPAEAKAAARNGWAMGTLTPADEAMVLASWPDALTAADHDARMDQLLWQGSIAQAQRQIALTSPARRPLFQARLDLRTNAPGAGASDLIGAGDAGYLADKAVWLTTAGAAGSARSLLARPHNFVTRPADAYRWFDLLLRNARAAIAAGDYSTAYAIASQVDDAYAPGTDVSARPLGERDTYTNLTLLAGQMALKRLGRPADAVPLFVRYAGGSRSTALKAKGQYWAGRAAQSGGRSEDAKAYLASAGRFGDQFYGQLATEALGQTLRPPADPGRPTISPAARSAFYASEVVRAAQYLGTIGAYKDQSAFIRQIAYSGAVTVEGQALAAELARTIQRPDLAVMTGRSALNNGLSDYTLTGFPVVNVPDQVGGMWTMAHAIMRQESQFDRGAISRVGAKGMMQLMPGTAREQAGKLGLSWDSELLLSSTDYNIQLGTAYFQRLYAQYNSYPLAVAAYNAGGGNVNKWLAANGDPRGGSVDTWIDWIEAIPIEETRRYVQHVLENAVVYDLINPQRSLSTGQARLSWYLGNKRPG